MDNTQFILDKYGVHLPRRGPIAIPNVGRNDLARLFNELEFRTGVEVGVERALFSEVLCKANPQAKVYGVDPWESYRNYRDHVGQDKLDGFYKAMLKRMASYPNYTPIRKFSMDAVKHFDNNSLDFVYIDGNHTLPYVINDIIEWSRKVRIGGIVSGHDYRKSKRIVTQNHVVYAVHCYTESYRIQPWFLLGTKAMNPGETRDHNRSWMWVKIR